MMMDPRRETISANNPALSNLLLEAGFYACINDCTFLVLATNIFKKNGYFLVSGRIYLVYHRDEFCHEPSKLMEYACFILTNIQDVIKLIENEHVNQVLYASKVANKIVVAIECARLNKLLEKSRNKLQHMSKMRSFEEITEYYWCIDNIQELSILI